MTALIRADEVVATYELGKLLAASQFFGCTPEQAASKLILGRECGFGPGASMTGIHVVQGKPVLGGHLIAAGIKRNGRYNYRVLEKSSTRCRIKFMELVDGKWEEQGIEEFTIQDAQAAGLMSNPTWKKYPQNMLFNRAISNGYKTHCPDVFTAPVYAEGELEAEPETRDVEDVEIRPAEPTVQDKIRAALNALHGLNPTRASNAVGALEQGVFGSDEDALKALRRAITEEEEISRQAAADAVEEPEF